jgi:hypothetical protein
MRYIPCIVLLATILLVSAASAAPIYVATGDAASIPLKTPGGSCWHFPESGIGYLCDFSPTLVNNQSYCIIPGKDTANLNPGTYTMVYQEPAIVGNKIFKDVSWINNTLVSSFAKTKPIDESGKQAPMVMIDLKRMIEANQFNKIISEQIFIEEPELKLTQLYQSAENLYTAKGTSNFADGTPITIKIDDARYYAQHDDTFIYHTKVTRQSSEVTGSWSIDMLMPVQEMPPGWHDIAVYSRDLVITQQFRIYEQEWGPAPAPTQYVKYLSDGNIAPVTVIQEKIVDHYVDRYLPPTPTPAITDALGKDIEYPYKTGEQIPPWVALIALLCIAGIILARDWKWR